MASPNKVGKLGNGAASAVPIGWLREADGGFWSELQKFLFLGLLKQGQQAVAEHGRLP